MRKFISFYYFICCIRFAFCFCWPFLHFSYGCIHVLNRVLDVNCILPFSFFLSFISHVCSTCDSDVDMCFWILRWLFFSVYFVFFCRSANYYQATGICELSEMDRITLAGTSSFQQNDGKRIDLYFIYHKWLRCNM